MKNDIINLGDGKGFRYQDMLDETTCETLDQYNKFKVMMIVFNELIRKLKFSNEGDIDCRDKIIKYYDGMNTNYEIKENMGEITQDFNILFVSKEEIQKSDFVCEDSTIGLKLLSLYEEELRNFVKNKLMKNSKIKNSIPNFTNNSDETTLINEICVILNENMTLLNEMFDNFKINEVDAEKKEINELKQNFEKLRNTILNSYNDIFTRITKDQSFVVIRYLQDKLEDENHELILENKNMEDKIKEYENQGEELSNLVKEYKKLCNLIECNSLNN